MSSVISYTSPTSTFTPPDLSTIEQVLREIQNAKSSSLENSFQTLLEEDPSFKQRVNQAIIYIPGNLACRSVEKEFELPITQSNSEYIVDLFFIQYYSGALKSMCREIAGYLQDKKTKLSSYSLSHIVIIHLCAIEAYRQKPIKDNP